MIRLGRNARMILQLVSNCAISKDVIGFSRVLWDHHVVILHLLDRRMTDIAEVVGWSGNSLSRLADIEVKLTFNVFPSEH